MGFSFGQLEAVVLGSCELGQPTVACLKVDALSDTIDHTFQSMA